MWPCVQSRLIVVLLDRHRVDAKGRWLEHPGRLAKGLIKIALRNEDRVWYYTAYKRNDWSAAVSSPEMLVSAEHGRFQGHFHERTFGVMGLLEYARVRNDARIMRFVQEFYEHARYFGIARMGYFPAVMRPVAPTAEQTKSGLYLAADGSEPQPNEGCAVDDMIWLATNLKQAARLPRGP